MESSAMVTVWDCVGGGGDGMGWVAAVDVLAVLDACAVNLCVHVLVDGASEGYVDGLYAFAYAEHGQLAVIGEARQEEFLAVALGSDGVELAYGLLSYEQRVYVASPTEDYAIESVEEAA